MQCDQKTIIFVITAIISSDSHSFHLCSVTDSLPTTQVKYALIIIDLILHILELEQYAISHLQVVFAALLNFLCLKTPLITRIRFMDILVYVLHQSIVLKIRKDSRTDIVIN